MGSTQDNLKSSNPKTTNLFEGIKALSRGKKVPEVKITQLSLHDLLARTDEKLSEVTVTKRADVRNESDRYGYNAKALVHLELAGKFLQYVIEKLNYIEELSPTEDFLVFGTKNQTRSGFGSLLRQKTTGKETAQTLVDLLGEIDARLEKAIDSPMKSATTQSIRAQIGVTLQMAQEYLHETIGQLGEVAAAHDKK